MLVVDAHVHLWTRAMAGRLAWTGGPFAPLQRDCTSVELAAHLADMGVISSVLVEARGGAAANARLLADGARSRLIGAVVAGLAESDGPERLDPLGTLPGGAKLRGVRVLAPGPNPPTSPGRGLERLAERLGAGGGILEVLGRPADADALARLAGEHPHLTIVVDHLAKPPIHRGDQGGWRRAIGVLSAQPNVRLKVSGLVTVADWQRWTIEEFRPLADAALTAFGPGRLMVGSDWPVCTVAGSYREVMETYLALFDDLGTEDRQWVLGRTAIETYAIEL